MLRNRLKLFFLVIWHKNWIYPPRFLFCILRGARPSGALARSLFVFFKSMAEKDMLAQLYRQTQIDFRSGP
jgi:hypothetical protein